MGSTRIKESVSCERLTGSFYRLPFVFLLFYFFRCEYIFGLCGIDHDFLMVIVLISDQLCL
jgi:hypothetical protein